MQPLILIWMGLAASIAPCVYGQAPPSRFDALLHQGFAMHRQGQYEQAIPLFRQALRLRPHDYFANLLLGIDELRTGHADRAEPLLQAAHAARPQDAMASGYLGEAYTTLRHYARAAAMLRKAADLDSSDHQAVLTLVEFELDRFASLSAELRSTRRGLAFAYLLQAEAQAPREEASALQALQHAAAIAPDLPGLPSALGQLEFTLGHGQLARQAYAQALLNHPNDLDAWVGQAQIAVQQRDIDAAGTLLDRVAAHSPHRLAQALAAWPRDLGPQSDPFAAAWSRHEQSGRPLPAIEAATAATIGSVPKFGAVEPPPARRPAQLFFSCLVRRESSHACSSAWFESRVAAMVPVHAPAIRHQLFEQEDWERVAQSKPVPDSGAAAFERGVAFTHLDRCGDAIPELERARADAALRPDADFYLSRCYAEDAGAIVEAKLQGAGQEVLVHEVRGDILLRLGNNGAGAVAEYRQALAVAPADPALWARLAEAERAAGHPDASTAAARKALSIDPHRLEAIRTLAQIAFEQKNYDAAVPWLQQVVARSSDDLEAQIELGTSLAREGKPQPAVSLLQHALQAGYPDERGALHSLLGTVLRRLGRSQAAQEAFQQAQQLSDAFSERAQVPHDSSQ